MIGVGNYGVQNPFPMHLREEADVAHRVVPLERGEALECRALGLICAVSLCVFAVIAVTYVAYWEAHQAQLPRSSY